MTVKVRVLFVCLGNICRSPTAHGIFQGLVNESGLDKHILVDSAGTGDWHVGHAPDERAQEAALQRGYDLGSLRARLVTSDDFAEFDYILGMDDSNLNNLTAMKPSDYQGDLNLFLSYGSRGDYREVPDPYYAGDHSFELVLDLVEDASQGLLNHIRNKHFSEAE